MTDSPTAENTARAAVLLPGDEIADELDATVMTLGRLFSARHGAMCTESGLSAAHLLTLRFLGEAGPVKTSDLAAHVGIKPPAASAMLDALEKRGHVRRETAADDRRVTLVSLTDSGAAELLSAEAERREHMRHYLSVLSEEDVFDLIRIHRKLIDALMSNRF